MTLIPDLERDLVHAAERTSRRRRRRAGLVTMAAAASAVIAAIFVLAVKNDSGAPPERSAPAGPAIPCAPGKPPTGARDWQRTDQRPTRSLTVLGCARLPEGRQVELVARKFRAGRCLDVYVPARRAALECAVGPLPRAKPPALAVSAFSTAETAAARRLGGALVVGWATGDVKRVELLYRASGGKWKANPTLIGVDAGPLVRAAGEDGPFGVFVFERPAELQSPRLVAYGANGKPLGVTLLPRALRD